MRLQAQTSLLLSILAFAMLIGLATLTGTLAQYEREAHYGSSEAIYLVPPAGLTRALSCGHHPLIADIYWVKTALYLSDILTSAHSTKWLQPLLNFITSLTPHFANIYIWGGAAFIYNGRLITEESVRLSNWILERGARNIPNNWEIPFMLAINYYSELREFKAAAYWMKRAAAVDGAPAHVRTLAARWLAEQGQATEAAALLKMQLAAVHASANGAGDRALEGKILARLKRVLDEKERSAVFNHSKALGERYRRELPFIDLSMFLLLDSEELQGEDDVELSFFFPTFAGWHP